MTPLYDNQEFYKKMLELQERLRKSEDERMKLEERFNLLSQDSRSRRETCINNLRMRYIDFLEEQRLRDERNHQILGALDKIDGSLARMTARTDRLGILRKQYEAYLLRVYANRSSGGGTGDSGVGSHNEDRSPKTNISQTEKNPFLAQRVVTQNAGNSPSFLPPTNYAQSYIRPSDISQFNIPRYAPAQETPQGHVMQAHGQGDSSTIGQSQRIGQQFYGSQNLNIPNTSIPKTQPMPNVPQEFVLPNRSHPQQFCADEFLRTSNKLAPNYAQVQHHQLHAIPNQYLENPRSPYVGDPSMARMRNLTDSQGVISSDLQSSPGLQSVGANARAAANFSVDLTEEAFGPYRHSTPLPGYLDYSTRYSRDPAGHEPNVPPRYGFTKADLENVIDRNERLLPRDYLHNADTVKPVMHTSKVSSPLKDKQRSSDARLIGGLNDNELDQYINRIRSLHCDNDHSLEVLDVEQNTSGDLLNATLSDDGPEHLTLHSDDRIKANETKILPGDIKSVFALADDFFPKTVNLGNQSQFNSGSSKDGEIRSDFVYNPQIYNENVVVKPTVSDNKFNDVRSAALKADIMTSDNLSISVTRDDILSGTAPVGVNQIHDTSAIANSKISPQITPPIADLETSRLNITDVATLSQNNLVDSKELSPNKLSGNQVMNSLKMLEKASHPDKEMIEKQLTLSEDSSRCQKSLTKDQDVSRKEIEVHEDIEGDKVNLIEGDQMPEQVIDVVRELQPPSLQHYEKNVVEIHAGNKDKKATTIRKVAPDGGAGPKIQENEDSYVPENSGVVSVAESLPQDPIAKKIYADCDVTDQRYSGAKQVERQMSNGSKKEISEDRQYQDNVESKYELNPDHEHPTYEHQPEQNLAQDEIENRDAGQGFEQNSEQVYGHDTNEQLNYDTYRPTDDESNQFEQQHLPASDKPHDSDTIYDSNQQYETDPSRPYAQESDPQLTYDPNQHFEGDANSQYTADPNEQYTADPNTQYTADPNEQYATDTNEQYARDPNEQYAADSNEQYAADPNEQYAVGSNEHYTTDPNNEYTADPNAQYDYYENQPYQTDPNATYENVENEQYGYVANQDYQHDPNQQYENDPTQQYEHDPTQQYDHDPNQQYDHDPTQQYDHDPIQQYDHDPTQQYDQDPSQQYDNESNEPTAQYPNQEYKEDEYGQNQTAESVGYEEPEQDRNQQYGNDSQQNNEDYPTAVAVEQNETQAATGDSYIQELSNPDDIRAQQYSTDEKKKNKDVISALLESDTESTIERNPSNNTESDFDFN